MYLAGVSVRRVEDITQALWGMRVSPSVVSDLNQKIYGQIEEWRNRPIGGRFAYVYLDGVWLKRSWGGEVKNVSILIAVGVNQEGFREVLAVAEGSREPCHLGILIRNQTKRSYFSGTIMPLEFSEGVIRR